MTNSASPVSRDDLDPWRLPRHVLPRRYELRLQPDLAAARFTGRVIVTAEVMASTRLIVLNAAELDVLSVHVDGLPAPFALDPDNERLHIGLIEDLAPGTAMIDISFNGTLNDKLRGFYRSTYRDHLGIERVIAASQMQATDCRRAFPCFDEPDFKAVFSTTLVVERGHLAVSNGPETGRVAEVGDDGILRDVVTFADTMPMSTYLVAFVVGPLEATAPVDVDGVPMRIIHTPGKGSLTAFGMDVGVKSLRWFVDYYGIPYPDAKIDMIALPDFAAGAMENVGCITYRESLLLVDPATSTQMEQQNVADVVSHELAHMWFGDLVTMKWWNGIWLNEAFATFMEVAAVEDYRPDWQRWTAFSLERSVAFEADSLENTRPVEFEVRSPADCDAMFDVLTYQKGGSLLRMLEMYLGTQRFRAGIRLYLGRHSYGNTETGDLWDAIEDAVAADGGEPVRELMDSWIWQPGYPLVTARIDGDGLVLSQQRFSFDPEYVPSGPEGAQTWLIPVHVRVGDRISKHLLKSDELRIPITDREAVIVVNADGFGYYRVSYSPQLLARIDRTALEGLATIERYALVDDAWNAVVAGRLPAADFVTFVEGFSDERELAVWQAIAAGLRSCARLVDDEVLPRLQSRVRRLVGPALESIGWDPSPTDDDLRSKLRGLLITLVAVSGGDAGAAERCRTILARADIDPASVHPELAAAATTVVAATGDVVEYERMLSRFSKSANPQEQLRFLYALTEFDDADLIMRTCEFAMSRNVKSQNSPFVLARCIASRRHGHLAWDFVRRHWDVANETFPGNTIVRMVDPVKFLNRPEVEADVQSFFREHDIPQAGKTLQQVLERQRVNVALRRREESRLADAL